MEIEYLRIERVKNGYKVLTRHCYELSKSNEEYVALNGEAVLQLIEKLLPLCAEHEGM